MKPILALLILFAGVACSKSNDSGGGKPSAGGGERKGTEVECTQLWAHMDYFDQHESEMSNEEKLNYCKGIQADFLGISCERSKTDENGNIEKEKVVVDEQFCSLF